MTFDTNIKEHLDKLERVARKRFPERNWIARIILWDDTDLRILLSSSWGKYQDVFSYRKSLNEYAYWKSMTLSMETEKISGKEILTEDDFK